MRTDAEADDFCLSVVGVISVTRYGRSNRFPFLAGVFAVLLGLLVLLIIRPILKGGRSDAEWTTAKSARPLSMPESPLRQPPSLTIPKPAKS